MLENEPRLKDAHKFEILYLELPFNKYFRRDLLSIGSLYWQANNPIRKYHSQNNFILSNWNSWKFFMRYAKFCKLSFADKLQILTR